MAITINRLTNGNVYIDGNNYFGTIEEVELPDIKATFSEVKVLGMNGKAKLPTGIEQLTSKLKLNGPRKEILKMAANPFQARQFMFRGSLDSYQGGSRTGQEPYKCYMVGTFENVNSGKVKQHDNVEMESTMNVTYCRLVIGNEEIFEVDVLNNIHKVGGVDILAQTNLNQGT